MHAQVRGALTLPRMKIRVDSDEFKCWHEVGHATVCLNLRGDVEGIEFLVNDARGHAVAHCIVPEDVESERGVACGGFAAEYYLLRAGYVDGVDLNDPRAVAEVSDLVFSNTWRDQREFHRRTVTENNDFTKAEKEEFMRYAIERVAPIFDLYFPRMQIVVSELLASRKIDGVRVKELLRIGIPR